MAKWQGGKGVNKDQTPSELAPGIWSDCQNMRFRNGADERVGGIAQVFGTPSITPYGLFPYSSGTTPLLVYCGTTKAYKHDGTTETEITRTTTATPQTVSSIARAANVVTVTTSAVHGLVTGNKVTVNCKSPTNMSGTNVSITVGSTTTFTYANTGANATGDAARTNYTILDSGSSAVNFTGGVDDKWTGGNFNGVIVVNNPVDGMFYYDAAGTGKLHLFAGTTYKSNFARPFKNYIVQGGVTVNGTKNLHGVSWSAAAVPGAVPTEFVASSTNDAGYIDVVSSGEAVDGMDWGEYFIVFKRDMRARLTYIGGNAVFDRKNISTYDKDDGLLAANCVVNTPVGQVFISNNKDIRIHQGGPSKSLIEGRMFKSFRSRIDPTYAARAFLAVNPLYSEVHVCFPEVGQTTCTKALIWNWNDDTWGERDLPNVTCGASGFVPAAISKDAVMLVGASGPKIGMVDSGTDMLGAFYTSQLERKGMGFDTPNWKTLHLSVPEFDGDSAFQASIYHGSHITADGSVTWASPQTYTHGTTRKVTAFASSGKYCAWKAVFSPTESPRLRSIDFTDGVNLDGSD